MLPAGHDWPVDRTLDMTQGSASLGSAGEESPSSHDAAARHNAAVPTDLISSQPVSMVDASSQGPPVKTRVFHAPQGDVHKPCCPRCGGSVSPRAPDHNIPPVPPALSRLQGSSLWIHSTGSSKRTNKSQDNLARSQIAAATQEGSCMYLVTACLWCQCSALLLALLEACSSSLHALCSSCCRCCARCCATLQDTPVEELHCHQQCHSVLFEACSCCESKECMEFCLDCCDICHHS